MKKLISIAVALALVGIVVLPIGAAGASPCDIGNYTAPTTFAKIPFAIVQSGFHLVGIILTGAGSTLGLPAWINAELIDNIGAWAGGPLGWSVDMLAWGLSLIGTVLGALPVSLGIPTWATDVVNTIACQLFAPFTCNVTGSTFAPCG